MWGRCSVDLSGVDESSLGVRGSSTCTEAKKAVAAAAHYPALTTPQQHQTQQSVPHAAALLLSLSLARGRAPSLRSVVCSWGGTSRSSRSALFPLFSCLGGVKPMRSGVFCVEDVPRTFQLAFLLLAHQWLPLSRDPSPPLALFPAFFFKKAS